MGAVERVAIDTRRLVERYAVVAGQACAALWFGEESWRFLRRLVLCDVLSQRMRTFEVYMEFVFALFALLHLHINIISIAIYVFCEIYKASVANNSSHIINHIALAHA